MGMFSSVALEDRIPADHALRGVRKLVDRVLAGMSKDFDGLYAKVGRPSIPPERLLRALLLQVFYSVRNEEFRVGVAHALTEFTLTERSARFAASSQISRCGLITV